ncbi:MAG: TraC family protein [Candidatus Pacebacteria bacterium]|jgi:hypothetical protein|nr:TraC family protein [Candidatus Paceibacterota bacterium]MBT6401685.1 TraC family protein [candidate division WWE3 bacterium]MBT7349579.1 TraC family protein [candidate division WWE3 bacterium]
MWLLNKSKSKTNSRKQIAIKEVRNGILVLPKNEYRLAIKTSSINFELKSEEEQDVIIDSYQNFLNSLPCNLQILVRVREVDIDQYLEQMMRSKDQEKEKVYQKQITNYCQFIKNLVSGNKILSRHFYIIVPYHHEGRGKDFDLVREQLHITRDLIMKGLDKLGIKSKSLDSLELLDLFYSFYNSSQIKSQELKGETIEALLRNNYV